MEGEGEDNVCVEVLVTIDNFQISVLNFEHHVPSPVADSCSDVSFIYGIFSFCMPYQLVVCVVTASLVIPNAHIPPRATGGLKVASVGKGQGCRMKRRKSPLVRSLS